MIRMHRLILCPFIFFTLILTGCNDIAFVDEFLDVPDNIKLECGDTVSIPFRNGNWDILSICTSFYLHGSVYDTNGHLIDKESSFQQTFKGLVCLNYDNELLKFKVLRRKPNELKVMLEEDLYDSEYELKIYVGQECYYKTVNLIFQPGEKYDVEQIAFDKGQLLVDTSTVISKERIVIDNTQSGKALTADVFPYKGAEFKIWLSFDEDDVRLGNIIGTTYPQVAVPTLKKEGVTIIDSFNILLRKNVRQIIPLDELELESVDVKVEPGGYTCLAVYLKYINFELPFVLTLHNGQTGRTRMLTGHLHGTKPYGYTLRKEKGYGK